MDMDTIESLSNRKSLCQDRIKEISGTPLPPQGQQEAVKVDYHWDILLKEMVGLSVGHCIAIAGSLFYASSIRNG